MPHIHEKIDFTVEVFVVHKHKVLLRMHDKYKMWLSIGGHIELDEDPNEAAKREAREEVGLDIKIVPHESHQGFTLEYIQELIPPRFLYRHHINSAHEHVVLVYFASADSDRVIPEKETDMWKWVNRGELETMDLLPHIKYYAEKSLEALA